MLLIDCISFARKNKMLAVARRGISDGSITCWGGRGISDGYYMSRYFWWVLYVEVFIVSITCQGISDGYYMSRYFRWVFHEVFFVCITCRDIHYHCRLTTAPPESSWKQQLRADWWWSTGGDLIPGTWQQYTKSRTLLRGSVSLLLQ